MRLSTRFAWMAALIPPAMLVVTGLGLLHQEGMDLQAERDTRLLARAEVLIGQAAALAAQGSGAGGTDRLREALASAAESAVIDFAGRRVTAGTVPSAAPLPVANGPFTDGRGSHAWRGYSLSAGSARVWVLESASVLNAQFGQFAGRLLVTALFSIPVALGAGLLLGRRASKPLRRLHAQAGWVAAGPGRRMGLHTGVREVDQVAMILDVAVANRELHQARTAEAWQAARSFAATAAHELRTPLTSMQASMDILSHPGAQPGDKLEALADLAAGQRRLLGLLDVLRALSQAELAGPDKFATVDLAELAESAVHAARSRHPGAKFTVAGPAHLVVFGWPDGLRMATDNLLDNAAVHGRSESGSAQVKLTMSQALGEVCIAVDDDGPGVAPSVRSTLFERFTRSPGSPGFGLGLAIVAHVVQLHGGTVGACTSPAGKGTRVLVRIPDPASQDFPKNPP